MHTPEWLFAAESPPTEANTRGMPFAVPAADGDWTALIAAPVRPASPGWSGFVTVCNPTAGALLIAFAATTATAVNGHPIPAGTSKRFFLTLPKHQRVCASGAGLTAYVSSYDTDLPSP